MFFCFKGFLQYPAPKGEGFSATRGSVKHAIFSFSIGLPAVFLKGLRGPGLCFKPLPYCCHGSNCLRSSRLLASVIFLSCRQRKIRGNRTATPLLYRGEA